MRFHIFGLFALVLASQCCYGSSGYQLDLREIQRQNRITAQILQNYLEKKLFPHIHKTSKAPSIWDILPRDRRRSSSNSYEEALNKTEAAIEHRETLESVESELINSYNSYYEDEQDNFIGC